jgi:hypothetical protein
MENASVDHQINLDIVVMMRQDGIAFELNVRSRALNNVARALALALGPDVCCLPHSTTLINGK